MDSYQQAEKAISDFFGDTRNSPQETKQGLEGLRDHIDMLIENLTGDGVE